MSAIVPINTSEFVVFEKDRKCIERNLKEILHVLCNTRCYQVTDSNAIKEVY